MRRAERIAVVLTLAALSFGACARPIAVRAPVMLPAQLPIRAFPSVWVVGGRLPEVDLGARLVAHLARDGQRAVRRVEVGELEPLREAGSISPLTLVVVLEPGIESSVRERYDVVPVQYCDFYWGCSTQFHSVYSATPEVVGELLVTVYEGPTARVLQHLRLDAVVYDRDDSVTRKLVADELGVQLERAVDVLKSTVRAELEPVDELPEAKAAIARIQAGDWEAGRAALEGIARSLGEQDRGLAARVWYDLGMARWYAPGPGGLTPAAFESAKQALERAIALDGSSRYRRALETLVRARERQAILDEQRRAAAHNFGLKGDSPAAQ